MNNEIKEILEQLEWYRKIGKKDVYYPECVLPNKKAFLLLDYITNLQEENEILAKRNNELKNIKDERFHNLKQENEELKKNQRYYKNGVFSLEYDKETLSDMIDDYKSRCEKAVEFIKKYCIDDEFYINLSYKEKAIIEVLNILQNGSDENVSDRD